MKASITRHLTFYAYALNEFDIHLTDIWRKCIKHIWNILQSFETLKDKNYTKFVAQFNFQMWSYTICIFLRNQFLMYPWRIWGELVLFALLFFHFKQFVIPFWCIIRCHRLELTFRWNVHFFVDELFALCRF